MSDLPRQPIQQQQVRLLNHHKIAASLSVLTTFAY